MKLTIFNRMARKAVSLVAITAAVFATGAAAENSNPYDGYKFPPLEVPSETRYTHEYVEILGSKMAYVDVGEGDPILFLHGEPTSSYLWRNIMPHLEGQGRLIAPDNIGFGKSDQPELDYTFGDHYRYFEAFVKELDLKNITLVVHDWGSGLGLHYASLNESNVKAIVTMEALMAPLLPAESYDTYPKEKAKFSRLVRDPVKGRKLVIEDNWFLEKAFPGGIVRPLDKATHDVYLEPFPTEKSRVQVFQWPLEIPIGGEPAETTKVISDYNAWLEKTEIPWLYLYARPGSQNPPEAAEYWQTRAKNIQISYIGRGIHFVQEDQPYAIGQTISDWYRRITIDERPKVRVLASYPSGNFLENLEVQVDGRLLFTNYATKTIEVLSPDGELGTFSELSAYPLSLVSTSDGYLVAASGKSLLKGEDVIGTQQFLLLDKSGVEIGQFDAPQALYLNGLVRLDNGTILVADSLAGTIWKVDIDAQAVSPWLQDESLAPLADQTQFIPGANGLKQGSDGLVVSNTSKGTLSLVDCVCRNYR